MSCLARVAVGAALLSVACGGAGASDGAASDSQDQTEGEKLPLTEVSGLASRDGRFVAVGDHSSTVVTFGLDHDKVTDVQKHKPLPKAGGSGSQFEAVTFDGAGSVVVLSETGRVVTLSDDCETELASTDLDWTSANPLVDGHVNINSLGEGVVVIEKNHLLVALEKSPSAIVEFGPDGDAPRGYLADETHGDAFAPPAKLVALKAWKVDDGNAPDLSELTVGPDHALWALSQQGKAIVRFERNLRADEDRASVKSHVRIPSDLEGAEGLTFVGTTPVVARDRQGTSKNLYVLDPIRL